MTDNMFTNSVISDLTKNADGTSTFTLSKPGEVETYTVTTPPHTQNIREWLHEQGETLKEQEYEQDMTSRDEAAKVMDKCGFAFALINLHANLDNREIHRVIERYKDKDVTFCLDETDSTPAQRGMFRRLWTSAGGPHIAATTDEVNRLIRGVKN